MSKNQDYWYTPPYLIEATKVVLGEIDLDPASSALANEIVKATAFYDKVTDGLKQHWRGRVWLNPPYDKPLPWTQKLIAHYQAADISSSIVLMKSDCSPVWARLLGQYSQASCLLSKRVRFLDPNTMEPRKGSSDFASRIFYFGDDFDGFDKAFSSLGLVYGPPTKLSIKNMSPV